MNKKFIIYTLLFSIIFSSNVFVCSEYNYNVSESGGASYMPLGTSFSFN